MREVTNLLINDFKIKELGYDFMGFSLQKKDKYTFHHLLIPARYGGNYDYWNGAILFTTPHSYLHIIETMDVASFWYLTKEMQDMKIKKTLDDINLMHIEEILQDFEYAHRNIYTNKGKKLIKDEYLNRKFRK